MLRLWLSHTANSVPIRGCLPNAVNSVQMGGGASQMLQIACTWKVWGVERGDHTIGGRGVSGDLGTGLVYIYI